EQIANVPIEDTRVIRLSFEAEMLDMFDLIDCPGISDPNMPVEVWERLVPEIDAVLWCTHATQAWRQSEATVWENIPEDVRKRSLLLITRFDKLKTERDRARVLARVSHETQDQFAGIYPMALLQALNADEDEEAWRASGAHDFTEALVAMIHDLQADGLADRSTATIAAAQNTAAQSGALQDAYAAPAPAPGAAAEDRPLRAVTRPKTASKPKTAARPKTGEAQGNQRVRKTTSVMRIKKASEAQAEASQRPRTTETAPAEKDPLVLAPSQKIVPLPTQAAAMTASPAAEAAQEAVDAIASEHEAAKTSPRRVTLSGTRRRARRPQTASTELQASDIAAEAAAAKPTANPSMGELRAALWEKGSRS
ncbi:MAG: hypothetical protein AAFY03_11320, partial [Pseudomonadota bacterium]